MNALSAITLGWLSLDGDGPGGLWFARGWPGVMVACLATLCVMAAVLMYRRQRALSLGGRIGLGLLRVAALLLLVAVFLQPSIGVSETSRTRKTLIVLLDTSQSMAVRDTRKRDEDVSAAAVAGGILPYGDLALQRQLILAERAMTATGRSFVTGDHGRVLAEQQRAAAHLGEAQDALASLGRAFDETGTVRKRLDDLVTRQQRLQQELGSVNPGSVQWAEAAAKQRTLRAELAAWAARVGPSPRELTTRDREQVAGLTRLDLVKGLLGNGSRNALHRLDEAYDVQYYAYSGEVNRLGGERTTADEDIRSLTADGRTTLSGQALQEAVERHSGPIAGVVVFTDGAVTGGDSPIGAARRMGERGIPVYPVAVGLSDPDDVSVESVIVQEVAFEGDTVPVRVQVRSRGYEKRQTYLTASLDGQRVASRPITLTGRPQFEEVFFDVKGAAGGAAQLEVAVTPFEGEASDENNRVVRSLRIVDEKINVLYVEGSARWEFRYLRAILLRDPRLSTKFIATRASPELARSSRSYLSRFPETPEEAFSFDLVILGDVDPGFFRAEELDVLERLVRERGGSMVMLAGRRYTPGAYADTPIERMLPVTFEPSTEWDEIGDDVHPVVTPAGRHSMVTSLAESARRNDTVWSRIKHMGHLPPVTDAKPGAVVLAELSDVGPRGKRVPLISWHRYGSGKAMFIATDRLWRLRYKTGDKYHWRMWSQTIQFLTLSRLLGENRRVILETDRTVYGRNEPVRLFANVVDEQYRPILAPFYDVFVQRVTDGGPSDRTVVHLKPEPGKAGVFVGSILPKDEGRYQLRADEAQQPFASESEFHVSAVQQEMKVTAMQQEELERIAEVSGGRVLSLAEAPAMEVLFDKQPLRTQYVRQVSLWDTWPVALAFILFTGSEWYLRRRSDLA